MHDLFKSIVDDFTSLPAKVAAAQAKASEVNVSNALYQFEAIADLYYRRFHRLAPGKSEALESYRNSSDDENRAQFAAWRASNDCFMDAIDRIVALDAKVSELEQAAERREDALADLVALVESIHNASEGRWPAIDINCAVCTQGCAPSSGVCAWHAAMRMLRTQEG